MPFVVSSQRREAVGTRRAPRVPSGKGAEWEVADGAEAFFEGFALASAAFGRRCCVSTHACAGRLWPNAPCCGIASLKRCMRHVFKTIGVRRALYLMCCCIVMNSSG